MDSGIFEPGDVCEAQTVIFLRPDPKPRRRITLLWRAPGMDAWVAAGRSTTDCRQQDLQSPQGDSPAFTKDGCFSSRFYHTFDANHCGTPTCAYLDRMTEVAWDGLRSAALTW